MKIQKENFQNLSQLDKIEYLLRKDSVIKNINKSLPLLEFFGMIAIFLYQRVYTLLLISTFNLTEETFGIVNFYSFFFNTVILILMISFIARIMIYFSKLKQLRELNEEFVDRLSFDEITENKNRKIKK